jgi:hypothetical protein
VDDGDEDDDDGSGAQFVALAIGLNSVDPAHYGGWSGDLTGCEPDARDMGVIARDAGLETHSLLTRQATRRAVLDAIAGHAARLRGGGLFVLSYSGHGGQLPDRNGDDPDDGMDETWCLYDGELLDDEVYAALAGFESGVRVLVFSDSCHSGTVVRMRATDFDPGAIQRRDVLRAEWSATGRARGVTVRDLPAPGPQGLAQRAMPPEVAIDTYLRNRAFYDDLGARAPADARASVRGQVLLVSGCEDDQLSADLGTNGLFTLELVRTWNRGAFLGGHRDFQLAIRQAVLQGNPAQAPSFFTVGAEIPGYEGQRPYTLAAP